MRSKYGGLIKEWQKRGLKIWLSAFITYRLHFSQSKTIHLNMLLEISKENCSSVEHSTSNYSIIKRGSWWTKQKLFSEAQFSSKPLMTVTHI